MLECLEILFLNKIHQLGPVDIHGEDSEEEEGLKIEISEQSHHSQQTKVLNGTVKNAEKESKSEDCDLGEQVLRNVPSFS